MQEPVPNREVQVLRGLLFTAFALVILAWTGFEVKNRITLVTQGEVAPGVVEYLNAGGSHPQIAFTTLQGEHISYPQGGLIFGYTPGQQVHVRYLRATPRFTAELDDAGALWGMTVLSALMGVVFAVVAFRELRGRQPGS